ncbi:MAG TPA: IPT/TIG domain-containing protein [Bryobacteraceae bacterium]|nr:IPT/TIG domain-containing protein [Bryobacteraceae bacterium]
MTTPRTADVYCYKSRSQRWGSAVQRIALAMQFAFLPNLLSQVNVLTANYDNSRANANLSETILKPSNVKPASFGKIGSFPVDAQIYAQPLYAAGIQIPGKGLRNVVYVATMHNTVYALDGDAPQSVRPLWAVNLGPSVPSSAFDSYTDIVPEIGILSTPVIDLDRNVIYVMSDTWEQGAPVFRIHALSLSDGHEMLNGPVVITGSVAGVGAGSSGGTLTFDPSLQLQRPGLALANKLVYIAFGSHADEGNFHGWIFAYDASDLRRQIAIFNATPDALGGSFWQGGRAPAVDASGNIIVVSGNGDFTGHRDFSDSVLKLSGGNLSLLDWYTPDNWAALRDADEDLGSAGAILLPNSNQLLAAGKSGDLLLIDTASMPHLAPMHSPDVQSFLVGDGSVFNAAVWNRPDGAIVYVQQPAGPLNAYRIVAGRLDTSVSSSSAVATGTEFCSIVVSGDSLTSGSTIVWQTTADYGRRQIPGTLRAFDATDLSHELWNSDMVTNRDVLGRFAKFATPTVANGRVYVPTFSHQLAIYGLISDAGLGNNDVVVTSVVNSASLAPGPVAPGELVTIFGAHIGPEEPSNLRMDTTAHASSVLAGTQVLFDGQPAPLLYASASEISAVVPFGVSGDTTTVEVLYRGQTSEPNTIPVVSATPALFASDGTGAGQGAIANADGSPNSGDNPAASGSIVTLYATGIGETAPEADDGAITAGLDIPLPILPVTVLVDGMPADVLYAGGAPGMVAGIFQLNVRIPATVVPDYEVPVNIKVGQSSSPTTITMAVR